MEVKQDTVPTYRTSQLKSSPKRDSVNNEDHGCGKYTELGADSRPIDIPLSKFVIPKKNKDQQNRVTQSKDTKVAQTKKKPLKCPNCSLTFTLFTNLHRHIRLHIASKHIHKCTACSYTTVRRDLLGQHMKSHSDERPFVCPECEMPFKNSCALRAHLMRHTGEKPFTCEECSATFRQKYSLKTHLMTHTGEKPYLCALCDKKFRMKRHLAYHMATHTNLKPMACGECGARFRDNSRLKMHMRKHTGEKAFACKICYRKFEIETNYQKHVLTHAQKF